MFKRSNTELLSIVVIAAWAIALAVFYSIRELLIGGALGFPLDDSWIHIVFARNIAHGDFFAYNPGHPVSGSTSPLWSIVLAAGYFVSHSPILMPKILGVAMNFLLGYFVWRMAEYLGVERFPAVCTALLSVGATRLVWASLSGMEVPLYVLLCFASIFAYFKYWDSTTWKFYVPWILFAVAFWARPELGLEPMFIVMHQILLRVQRRTNKKNLAVVTQHSALPIISWRKLIYGGIVSAVGSIPFFLLNHWLSSNVLPLTFTAKTGAAGVLGLVQDSDYFEILRRSFLSLFIATGNSIQWVWLQDNLVLVLIAVAGFFVLLVKVVRRRVTTMAEAAMLFLALHLLFYAPVRSVITGALDFGQYGRYIAQTTPIIMLLGALVLCVWMKKWFDTLTKARTLLLINTVVATGLLAVWYASTDIIGRGHESQRLDWNIAFLHQGDPLYVFIFAVWAAGIAIAGIQWMRSTSSIGLGQGFLLLQLLGFSIVENIQVADEYSWNVRNINDTQVLIGKWIAATLPPGTTYATNDIGAMAYYADRDTIIDVIGLVQPEVAVRVARTVDPEFVMPWTMKHFRPSYLIVFDDWFPRYVPEARRDGALERVKIIPIVNNITCGGKGVSTMTIYKVHPEHLDEIPDYMP